MAAGDTRGSAELGGDALSIVDLTLPIRDGMDAYPGEPTATFRNFSTVQHGGVEMWHVELFSQLGTHADAPSHFVVGGPSVEQLSLTACVGPAVVVDVPVGGGELVTPMHLAGAEDAVRDAGRVILRTGWSARYGTPSYWTEFPELVLDASQALVSWGAVFVGLDTPSPHRTQMHEVHHALLGAGVVLVECLTNLEALTDSRPFLVCLPLPLVGLDGSPVRAIAIQNWRST